MDQIEKNCISTFYIKMQIIRKDGFRIFSNDCFFIFDTDNNKIL